MGGVKNMEKLIDNFEDFLQHNIKTGYITKETSVEDLLRFIKGIKCNYIPIMKDIEENINL